jgi:hypothetical protein
MDTWFKCFHKLRESEVFKNSHLLHVWIWCLLSAKYMKCSTCFYSGKRTEKIELLPGEFIFGRKKAAEELNMTESGFYKRLKKLEKMKNVNIESNNRFSKITIINWDTYQGSFEKSNSESNSQVTAKEQPGNTINRYIDNIDKNISVLDKPKRKRSTSGLTIELQESFSIFWSAYPKHEARVMAEKAWLKISPQNGLVETICTAVEKFKQSPKWTKDNGEYIPMPSTWLNQRRWEDESIQGESRLDLDFWRTI